MNKGTLYIVATPIGNLGDITFRAVETLKNVDVIVAEDTRHTLKLLNNLGIKNRLISFFEHSPKKKTDEIINLLEEGKDVALVSDAGMPIISDPGASLTEACANKNIPMTCVPGACAAVSAVAVSGISAGKFIFEGFLPKDKSERKEAIINLMKNSYTTIVYESPHAIKQTLADMAKIDKNRRVTICKELTKIHEEVIRGTLEKLAQDFSLMEEIRGEFVIVIDACIPEIKELTDEDILTALKERLDSGMMPKSAIREVSVILNVSKNRVYRLYTENM